MYYNSKQLQIKESEYLQNKDQVQFLMRNSILTSQFDEPQSKLIFHANFKESKFNQKNKIW